MKKRATNLSLIAVFLSVTSVTGLSLAAQVETCLEIKTDEPEQKEGLDKLVTTEMARHPSHRVVEENCSSEITVELFSAGGQKHLTVRTNNQVPVRYTIDKDHPLSERLSEAISLVLGNDPVLLAADPARLSTTQRAVNGVVVKGINSVSFELVEALARTGKGIAFATGGAVEMSRGYGHWVVSGRVYGMGGPKRLENEKPSLRVGAGADVGVSFEFNEKANNTLYIGLGLGLQYLRFEGRLPNSDKTDYVSRILPVGMSRIGVRLFRCYDFNFEIFASGYLPMMNTKQTDSLLFGEEGRYTPSFQIGAGVGF